MKTPPQIERPSAEWQAWLQKVQAFCTSARPDLCPLFKRRQGDRRLFIDVSICGQKVSALLDTGASVSVFGSEFMDFVKHLNHAEFPYKEKSPLITLADSSRPTVLGTVALPVTYHKRTEDVEFTIIPSVTFAVILGIDFCHQFRLVMSFVDKTCHVQADAVPTIGVVNRLVDQEELTALQVKALATVVKKYANLSSKAPGLTHLIEHQIDTGDAKPIRQRQYALSPAIQRQLDKEIEQMLEMDVIEPSHSPWCSPLVMVNKKDGTYRMCFDGRKLNEVTVRDSYPLPLVDSILSKLRDAVYLSSLDLTKAFWNIPLKETSRPKTAFLVRGKGLFQFKRMPFGLCNSAQTMQRLVDSLLGPELEEHVFVYLDDIIIVTSDFEQHIRLLEEVHRRLEEAGLKINFDKCQFCRPSLHYLGYVVDQDGLRTDPEKVNVILRTEIPKTTTEVRRVMGVFQWYRRFIKDFSSLSYPITSLIQGRKKGQRIVWTPEADVAFETLKERLVSAPVLASPDFSKPFAIQTDASDVGLGAVLFQEADGFEHPIAYASRTLTRAEQKYSVTERECLAVLFGVEKFRCYVEGTDFTVFTDHASLKWLYNLKDPIGRLARWCIRLSQFAFTLVHRKGTQNVVADFLSRHVAAVEAADLHPDEWYDGLIRKIQQEPQHYPDFQVDNNIIYKHFHGQHGLKSNLTEWKVVVPTADRARIMSQCHDTALAGHFGVQKTWARIFEQFYWPGMRKDIRKFVKTCDTCGAYKVPQNARAGLMGAAKKVSFPFQLISLDLMGPLPRSRKGNTQLLVVCDWFTKFVLVQPLAKATASSVVKFLENQVFLLFGVPQIIMCDNGSQFTSKEFKNLLGEYKVRHLWYNARYHAQVNPTERVNKVIGTALAAQIRSDHRLWDVNIQKVAQAIRTANHDVTGFSPAFLTFGRNVPLDGEFYGPTVPDGPTATREAERRAWVTDLQNMPKLVREVRIKLATAYEKTRRRYDLRRRPVAYQIGAKVWKRNFVLSDAGSYFSKKLAPKYVLCKVARIVGTGKVYELEDLQGKPLGRFHVQDLKPYYARQIEPPNESEEEEAERRKQEQRDVSVKTRVKNKK